MIVPYTDLPDVAGGQPRPLLDVLVGDMDDAAVPCLVDSGALNTLIPSWIARAAGVNLERASRRHLAVAGAGTTAAFVTILLTAADFAWEAEVGFCDPWPYGWGLLGQASFFRYFTVTFRAADLEFELEPVTS